MLKLSIQDGYTKQVVLQLSEGNIRTVSPIHLASTEETDGLYTSRYRLKIISNVHETLGALTHFCATAKIKYKICGAEYLLVWDNPPGASGIALVKHAELSTSQDALSDISLDLGHLYVDLTVTRHKFETYSTTVPTILASTSSFYAAGLPYDWRTGRIDRLKFDVPLGDGDEVLDVRVGIRNWNLGIKDFKPLILAEYMTAVNSSFETRANSISAQPLARGTNNLSTAHTWGYVNLRDLTSTPAHMVGKYKCFVRVKAVDNNTPVHAFWIDLGFDGTRIVDNSDYPVYLDNILDGINGWHILEVPLEINIPFWDTILDGDLGAMSLIVRGSQTDIDSDSAARVYFDALFLVPTDGYLYAPGEVLTDNGSVLVRHCPHGDVSILGLNDSNTVVKASSVAADNYMLPPDGGAVVLLFQTTISGSYWNNIIPLNVSFKFSHDSVGVPYV